MTYAEPWWVTLLAWILSAGIAFLAIRAVDRTTDDRLVAALAGITGCVFVWRFAHGIAPLGLALIWSVCAVLAASVCADLRTRRVPPLLVLPVTIFAIAVDVRGGDFGALAIGAIIGALFAFTWMRTRGRSAGLGDAQLAALAGLVLGLELGTIVVAAACLAAAGFAFARKERGAVAFSPYLAAAIAIALLLPAIR